MTRMSSIFVSSIAARITRLSMVGSAVPACHLATACVETPSVSATSFTLMPAALRSALILAPVCWISMVGTFIFFCCLSVLQATKNAACRNESTSSVRNANAVSKRHSINSLAQHLRLSPFVSFCLHYTTFVVLVNRLVVDVYSQ